MDPRRLIGGESRVESGFHTAIHYTDKIVPRSDFFSNIQHDIGHTVGCVGRRKQFLVATFRCDDWTNDLEMRNIANQSSTFEKGITRANGTL